MSEVILLEKITNLGNIGDLVKVKDGFARNYLLRFGKALRATQKNKDVFEQKRAILEQENELKLQSAKEIAVKLEGIAIEIYRPAGEDGRLYGAVTPKDIAKELSDSVSYEILSSDVITSIRMKEVGVYDVEVILHPDVTVKIQLNIRRKQD